VRDNPEVNKTISSMTALGRPGVPDDVGPMIAALLSDENRLGQRPENRSLRWVVTLTSKLWGCSQPI
jgi:hypothetical protein